MGADPSVEALRYDIERLAIGLGCDICRAPRLVYS